MSRRLESAVGVDGAPLPVELISERPGQLVLRIDGLIRVFDFAVDEDGVRLCNEGRIFRFDRPRPSGRRRRDEATGRDEMQRSPMPALVASLEVAEGQEIEGGRTLLILEAMKMETRMSAPPGSWKVAKVFVTLGQQVGRDQELVELAPRPKEADRTPDAAEESGGKIDR